MRQTHSVPVYTQEEKHVNGNTYPPVNQAPVGFQYKSNPSPATGFKKGTCKHCGDDFTKHTTWQKFCSADCRKLAWTDKRKQPL